MSYNVYVYIPAAVDPDAEAILWEGNYTSNVAPMWRKAIGDNLGRTIDMLPFASTVQPILAKGIKRMRANPDEYRAMNSENGWGNYEGALAFLEEIEHACRNYPMARVRASR
jgi:hypothetical protein